MASRRYLLAALPLVVVGCGAPPDASEEHVGSISEAQVVCASGPTVTGVDVSHYQGAINWSAVKASGRAFAIASVGDGSYQDPTFATNWPGMKAAGLIRGAYQFFEPGEDPTMQANIMISKVGKLGDGDLPCTLDVEVTGGQSAATIAAHIKTWVDAVQAGTGKKPIIYTGKYFWQDNVASSTEFTSYPLWVAAYGVSCPNLPDGTWGGWKMWQSTDAASVGGISGGVDGDVFNGTLADLQAFAGGGSAYAAQFVAQSWPYATTTMSMTAGSTLKGWIELKNVGTKAWDSKTKLGTTVKRDRSSPFYGSDWLAPNRLVAVSGTVPPGSSYKFQFEWHAPSTPGSFDEHYDLVEEGVAWFSDPGQGGPADDVIEAKIDVTAAKYAAAYVGQSFPTSDKVLAMKVGDSVDGYIELKNVGTEAWKAGETKLAPTPRDKTSPLAASNWLSPTRISSPAADVAPGSSFKFPVTLTATTAGDFPQTFGVVEEGVTWFADAPNGGGPADDLLKVHVVATADGTVPDAGGTNDDGGASTGDDGGTSGSEDGGLGGAANDGGTDRIADTSMSGGCSYGSDAGYGASSFAFFALAIAAAARRSKKPH